MKLSDQWRIRARNWRTEKPDSMVADQIDRCADEYDKHTHQPNSKQWNDLCAHWAERGARIHQAYGIIAELERKLDEARRVADEYRAKIAEAIDDELISDYGMVHDHPWEVEG